MVVDFSMRKNSNTNGPDLILFFPIIRRNRTLRFISTHFPLYTQKKSRVYQVSLSQIEIPNFEMGIHRRRRRRLSQLIISSAFLFSTY